MLSLKLLGGASVERSGTPVPGRAARGHRLALLALLARGRPLSRDKVLALLWPESDTDRGRCMLSETLYLLRGAFGEDVLVVSGDDLRLNPERMTSDVDEFERLLDERRLESAVRMYAGPFLDGFHLADTANFEQWVDTERAQLAQRYSTALEALAETSEGENEWGAAVGWWRRLAAIEPGDGRVALRLMRALDAAGDRAASGLQGYWRRRLELELRESAPAPEPLRIAALVPRIGDAEQAAVWLERAYRERSLALPFLGVLPVYERVRSHPKVVAILEEMKVKSAGVRE